MTWESWHAFWAMGGYGLYVWGAYLLVLVIVASEIVVLIVSRRSILEHLGLNAPGDDGPDSDMDGDARRQELP